MTALCPALRRRSPLRFPVALFSASPVPSFVLHPRLSLRCACTLPRTKLALSSNFPRVLSRMAPALSSTLLPCFPPYCAALCRDTPMLSLALRRCCTSCCSGAVRSPLPRCSFRAAPTIFLALFLRFSIASLVRCIALRWVYSSRCSGNLVRARQPYRFSIAGVIVSTAPVLSLALCRRLLLPCASGLFALRRRSLSCCAGAIVCGPPGLSLSLRPCSLSPFTGAILWSLLVLSFTLCRRSFPHMIGAVPGTTLSPLYMSAR